VQFCSTKCRENYKRQRERNKAYWRWLYKAPESSAAEQN
jgi:ribosomal protein L24E